MGFSKRLLAGLALVSGAFAQNYVVYAPGSAPFVNVCAVSYNCDESGICHPTYWPNVPITVSDYRYDQSGGHQHTGGPTIGIALPNPQNTGGNGCVNKHIYLPYHSGIFNLTATASGFSPTTLQIWGQQPFTTAITLAASDVYHPYNYFVTQATMLKSLTIRTNFYNLSPPYAPGSYALQILRGSNNWGGILDGVFDGGFWSGYFNEGHIYGTEFDVAVYSDPIKMNALEAAVSVGNCSIAVSGNFAHVSC